MDDSGTGDKDKQFQLMTAVVVPDSAFRNAEMLASGSVPAFLPEEQRAEFWKKFEEFKGWELFGGYGPFDGVDQKVRFRIVEVLLTIVKLYKFPVIYGAVDKAELKRQVYSSASPLDICFRLCINGVNAFMENNASNNIAIVIADESNKEKKLLRAAFYEHRERMHPFSGKRGLPFFHDDMYFGDSKYSIGLQFADLCGYFISKHLQKDQSAEGFYEIIKDQIVYSRTEPQ